MYLVSEPLPEASISTNHKYGKRIVDPRSHTHIQKMICLSDAGSVSAGQKSNMTTGLPLKSMDKIQIF